MIYEADNDRDGKISYDEFRTIINDSPLAVPHQEEDGSPVTRPTASSHAEKTDPQMHSKLPPTRQEPLARETQVGPTAILPACCSADAPTQLPSCLSQPTVKLMDVAIDQLGVAVNRLSVACIRSRAQRQKQAAETEQAISRIAITSQA